MIYDMEQCRYCNANFSSRQSRWRHEKNTCPASLKYSRRDGRGELHPLVADNEDTSSVAGSSDMSGTVRSSESNRKSEQSSDTDQEMGEYASEEESVNEMGEREGSLLNEYADMVTMQLCEDAENDKEFKLQVVEEIRRNKAVRSARWFQEINSQVNHLIYKGYDVDEAINAAVHKRKFMIKSLYSEYRNRLATAQRLEAYNNIITKYA